MVKVNDNMDKMNICESEAKDIKKIVKIYNTKTKLSRKVAFELETEALTKISDSYKCYCCDVIEDKKIREHFPKIIRTVISAGEIYLTNCGKSLNISGVKKDLKDIDENILKCQLTCIMKNLIEAGVKHVDMPINGQNLCWDGDTLSLIDFDACVIDDKPKSGVLKRWRNMYGSCEDMYIRLFSSQMLIACK